MVDGDDLSRELGDFIGIVRDIDHRYAFGRKSQKIGLDLCLALVVERGHWFVKQEQPRLC